MGNSWIHESLCWGCVGEWFRNSSSVDQVYNKTGLTWLCNLHLSLTCIFSEVVALQEWPFSLSGLVLQAKITLVPELKDLLFSPGPFGRPLPQFTRGNLGSSSVNVCLCMCVLSSYCREIVEGQRAGSWPPASVTLVEVVEEREEEGAAETDMRNWKGDRKRVAVCECSMSYVCLFCGSCIYKRVWRNDFGRKSLK